MRPLPRESSKRTLWITAERARRCGWEMAMSADGHLLLEADDTTGVVITAVASAHPRTAGNVAALAEHYGRWDGP